MKKLVCVLAAVAFAGTAFGQGTLIYANSAASLINTNNPLGRAPIGTHTALYYSTDLGAAESALTLNADATRDITSIPGQFNGGTRTLAGVGAGTILAQVRAWTGPFTSYEAAMGSGDTQYWAGKSQTFNIALVLPPTPPTSINTLMGTITMAPVPEPSTLALGAMGLLGLYLIRRRK